MEIPSELRESPEFQKKLKGIAQSFVYKKFDPRRRGFDREEFVNDLIAEADLRIVASTSTATVNNWLGLYHRFMQNIVYEHLKRDQGGRDPLAYSKDVDEFKASDRFKEPATIDEANPIRLQTVELLRAFCREHAEGMKALGPDPFAFERHWTRWHESGLSLRAYLETHPGAPSKSSFSRWAIRFRMYAREHWRPATIDPRDDGEKQ